MSDLWPEIPVQKPKSSNPSPSKGLKEMTQLTPKALQDQLKSFVLKAKGSGATGSTDRELLKGTMFEGVTPFTADELVAQLTAIIYKTVESCLPEKADLTTATNMVVAASYNGLNSAIDQTLTNAQKLLNRSPAARQGE